MPIVVWISTQWTFLDYHSFSLYLSYLLVLGLRKRTGNHSFKFYLSKWEFSLHVPSSHLHDPTSLGISLLLLNYRLKYIHVLTAFSAYFLTLGVSNNVIYCMYNIYHFSAKRKRKQETSSSCKCWICLEIFNYKKCKW